MNVMIVDDERIILSMETAMIRSVLPAAAVASFRSSTEAIEYAEERRIDIAFLDINMKGCTGLELAKKLKKSNPQVNIIFCTGYAEYALEAYSLYASAYLLKPISEEKIKEAVTQLRFPVPSEERRVSVRCFGEFEVLCDGKPIKFKYGRTKELFAYLIDRNGALMNNNELMTALFAEDTNSSYTRNMKTDLTATFQQLGIADVLVQ